ncbi:MAG: class I SAM-dependent methyltransferase [Bacteroidetes bacterium]|nr:class I SAM-dependent methyltransferase [Bacteroidota bacterium]
MYSPFQILLKYLRYYVTSGNGKGHGIHSPFVYDLVRKVWPRQPNTKVLIEVEQLRKKLLKDTSKIWVEDHGAGSSMGNQREKPVCRIAKYSLKSPKYAGLLFRLVQHFKPSQILELGTSLGITTAYMAVANRTAKVFTIEGAPLIASMAERHFQSLGLLNIKTINATFEKALPLLREEGVHPDFIFIDGHHTYEATLRYFSFVADWVNESALIVLDDIHWSEEMEKAWAMIQAHPKVTLTIDLFFMGLVFMRKEQMVVQHFRLHY